MTQPSKPSAGALRAARRLLRVAQSAGTELNMYDEEIAKIIDRETGVAELLEAARHVIPLLHRLNMDDCPLDRWGPKATHQLEQAIAKCESGAGSE